MRSGEAIPQVRPQAPLAEVILEVSRKGMGFAIVTGPDGALQGVFTDGDLRRLFDRAADFRDLAVADVMSRTPRSIGPQALAVEAVELMERHRVSQLPVTDEQGRVVGALNMLDLFAAGVV
jgi:arabinose-5-phosphate isomerase